MIEKSSTNLERTVLVGIITLDQPKSILEEYLNELSFLTYTAGGTVVKTITQKMDSPDPKTFLGKGKMEELCSYIKIHDINSVIFDDELSPTQQSNIEKQLRCKIVDRTGLILDIFAQRAKTSYARNQVELAQYQYILPRLKGLWTHLERQKGGIGMRGPGETEIETDRRIVRNKINLLKKKLVTIDKQMSTQRGNRGSLVRAALVGYTNVGKSTLMNSISCACLRQVTVFGLSANSAATDSKALCLAFASMALPTSTKVMTTADASKYRWPIAACPRVAH